jgi:putative ubiquitin-RnfH superfamily antitoxin RatB of RatAB toxin-antitoxin module
MEPRSTLYRVEVVYAEPRRQVVLECTVAAGTTVREAIVLSGMLTHFPEIDLQSVRLGIYGRTVKPGARVGEGDRVEIYRPLIADPKEARRHRARAPAPGR